MPRYVDADAAKAIYLSKSAGEQLDRVPTADVQKVRHGKWIKKRTNVYFCSMCGRLEGKELECVVPEVQDKMVYVIYPYCHCGAKMDGKTND